MILKLVRVFVVLVSLLTLSACSGVGDLGRKLGPALKGGQYIVRADDSLESIAWRYRVQVQQLAAWNDLPQPYAIYVGQRLKLYSSGTTVNVQPVQAPIPRVEANSGSRVVEMQPIVSALPSDAQIYAESQQIGVKNKIRQINVNQKRQFNGSEWSWPINGAVIRGFSASGGANKRVDIRANVEQEVRASGDGEIIFVGDIPLLGQTVIVDHGQDLISSYSKLKIATVKERRKLSRGQAIGVVAEGSELQVEFRLSGEAVDPQKYLP